MSMELLGEVTTSVGGGVAPAAVCTVETPPGGD
jgi:hypothetical protein